MGGKSGIPTAISESKKVCSERSCLTLFPIDPPSKLNSRVNSQPYTVKKLHCRSLHGAETRGSRLGKAPERSQTISEGAKSSNADKLVEH